MNIGQIFKGQPGSDFEYYKVSIVDVEATYVTVIVMDCEFDETEIGDEWEIEIEEFNSEFMPADSPLVELKSGQTVVVPTPCASYESQDSINQALLLGLI